jgi:hypothetical protein
MVRKRGEVSMTTTTTKSGEEMTHVVEPSQWKTQRSRTRGSELRTFNRTSIASGFDTSRWALNSSFTLAT